MGILNFPQVHQQVITGRVGLGARSVGVCVTAPPPGNLGYILGEGMAWPASSCRDTPGPGGLLSVPLP